MIPCFDFEKDFETEYVIDLLRENNVSNIGDLQGVLQRFYKDYMLKRVNLCALITPNVNLRVVMWRRIAVCVLRSIEDEMEQQQYYKEIMKQETVEQVINWCNNYFMARWGTPFEYNNDGFIYWVLYCVSVGVVQHLTISFDFEYLYADCDKEHKYTSEQRMRWFLMDMMGCQLLTEEEQEDIENMPKLYGEEFIEDVLQNTAYGMPDFDAEHHIDWDISKWK